MTAPDVVVIGSGPCGAIAATELIRRGLKVTMLEGGHRPVRGIIVRAGGKTIFRWAEAASLRSERYVATGDPTAEWISSLSLGGLSNYWTAAVPRMAPEDFSDGAALDERFQWPISYGDLEPFYQRVERELSITAGDAVLGLPQGFATYYSPLHTEWQALAQRAADNGDGLGPMPMAKGPPWLLALRPTGFNSFHCLVKRLLSEPRFRLIRGAVAVHIDAGAGPGAELSVTYAEKASRQRHKVHSRAVVVAAGSIASTKLLLQSKTPDFPDGLGNTHGLVGRYLHDHARQWWPARLERSMPELSHPLYIARQSVAESDPLRASSLTLGMVGAKARIRSWYGGRSDVVGVQVLGTMVPSSDCTVRLRDGGADDPLADVVEVCIHYDEDVHKTMAAARDRLAQIFGHAGLRVSACGPYHEINPGSSVHYGGTVRMHADRRFGVLDAWNRVYDAPNVLVCDASCFPTGPEKNPTLSSMAIAARAMHRLASELS
jgi:choline dehydrogenase-like flavoprotein